MKTAKSLWHQPVMPKEVVQFLKCKTNGCYVDATIGGGGHAEEILESTSPSGKLLGVDRDPYAVARSQERLKLFGKRIKIIQGVFSDLDEVLRVVKWSCADGILLDLGVSSRQLDEADRGFGFKKEGPLDMRMNPDEGESAADVLKNIDEEELTHLIREYGEERFSRSIAKGIVKRRSTSSILTTKDLANTVVGSLPPSQRYAKRIHPATRTFQALRIHINNELRELSDFLKFGPKLLCPGGRLLIISYHSLEDRLVKRAFRNWGAQEEFKVITKKIISPLEKEKKENPRSRSAKLRVLERIGK